MKNLNPTEKLIKNETLKVRSFLEEVLLLAAKMKTLNYSFFKDKLHPKMEKIFFESFESVRELDEIKSLSSEMNYYDALIVKCYNTMYDSSSDRLILSKREEDLRRRLDENLLNPKEKFFYFGIKEDESRNKIT